MEKVLVLCGGYPQLALMREFKRRGLFVYLADMNNQAVAVPFADKFLPISAMDVEAVKKAVKEEGIDYVITAHADQALMVAAKVSEELGLRCYLDCKTAIDVSNKAYMKQVFKEGDVPTSNYVISKVLDLGIIKSLRYPLIVKPVDSYSSRGVRKVDNFEELKAAFENAVKISKDGTAVIEEYVGGKEVSVDVYVENGKAYVLGTCDIDKLPEPGKFIICRGKYPAVLTDDEYNQIVDVANKIAQAFHLVDTPMMIQLKVWNGKVYVLEFCARNGGGIKFTFIKKVSGFDSVKAVADLTLGDKPHVDYKPYPKCICNEFLYCNPGELDHVENFDKLLEDGIVFEYYVYRNKGHVFGEVTCSADRVGCLCFEGDTWEEVAEKRQKGLEMVKVLDSNGNDILKRLPAEFGR